MAAGKKSKTEGVQRDTEERRSEMPPAKTHDVNELLEEMLVYMRFTFNTYIESMIMLQNQTVRILNTFTDQGIVTQKEAHKMIREWTNSAKRATSDFQKITEENLGKLSEFVKK